MYYPNQKIGFYNSEFSIFKNPSLKLGENRLEFSIKVLKIGKLRVGLA
jgi:hypothetical protein